MKFMGLVLLAVVAVSMAAEYQQQQQQQQQPLRKEHQLPVDQKDIKFFNFEFAEFFQRFYEFFKDMFYTFYQSFYQNFAQFVPVSLANASQKVFEYWPSYEQVFSPEFYKFFTELVRAIKDFFMPHHFYTFVDQAFQAFPTVTEFFPAGFFPTIANCIQHFPFIRDFLYQWFVAMQQLLPHLRQN